MLKDKFIDYLTFERRYSPHTLIAYKTDLDEFEKFIAENFDLYELAAASHTQIRTWLVKLFEDKLNARSVNRKISTLKSFYRYCLQQKIIDKNPMLKVVAPSHAKTLPHFFTTAEIEKLLNSFDKQQNFEATRNQLIIKMLYATGMRRAELIGLQINNLDFSNATIQVHGKGGKDRIIPIATQLIDDIKQYLYSKEQYFLKNSKTANIDTHVFVSTSGKPMYAKQVYNIVHAMLEQISLKGKLSPHVLRHTFATHMLDNGADLNAIKEMLGHASLASTQVYTHNTIEKLKKIYKQAHPRA